MEGEEGLLLLRGGRGILSLRPEGGGVRGREKRTEERREKGAMEEDVGGEAYGGGRPQFLLWLCVGVVGKCVVWVWCLRGGFEGGVVM